MTFPPHPLTNFEIQEYYQNEPRFDGVETHWVALYVQSTSVYDTYVNNKILTYFDSFGVEHIPKEIMKFINCKKIITNFIE